MIVFGLDPGTCESAIVGFDGRHVVNHWTLDNHSLLRGIKDDPTHGKDDVLVIEMIQSYGMAVGASVFETVFWTGRFFEAWPRKRERLTRGEIKLHLCKTQRAKDTNVRQAIFDRFGGKEKAVGKKASPGPLYGLVGHEYAALAVALTWWDQRVDNGAKGLLNEILK